jgi:hypothetical protein
MKVIRSMENYDHKFVIRERDSSGNEINAVKCEIVLMGRMHQPKNITIIDDDADFEELKKYPQVTELLKRNVLQILDDVPQNYYDANEILAINRGKLLDKEIEIESKNEQLSEKDAEIEKLKQQLKDNGIKL